MKSVLWLIGLLLPLSLYGQPPFNIELPNEIKHHDDYNSIVYINPDYTDGNSDGSKSRPYTSWSDIGSFSPNTAYLQKGGTRDNNMSGFEVKADNVLIGAYGSGNRPVISGRIYIIGDYVTLRDMEISGGGVEINHPSPHPVGTVIYNNVIHGGPILSAGNQFRILHNELYDVYRDGMFIQYARNFEIAYNHIHHVNTAWEDSHSQDVASGDGIQLNQTNRWWVHHNIIDRSNSGNKFCLIATQNLSGVEVQKGLMEYNTLKGPLREGDGGASIFIGGAHDSIFIARNTIKGPSGAALYHHSNMHFYNNIVDGTYRGVVTASNTGYVYNNLFVNIESAQVTSGSNHLYNNIFEKSSGLKNVSSKDNNIYLDQTSPEQVFVDFSRENYELKEGSPAINAGDWKSFFAEHYDHGLDSNEVPQNSNIDVGPFQYSANTQDDSDDQDSTDNDNDQDTTDTQDSTDVTTGIGDQSRQEVMKIFPNPANNTLYVTVDDIPVKSYLTVVSMEGKAVLRREIYPSSGEKRIMINLSGLPKGVYILRLHNPGMMRAKKFIKSNR